MIANTRLRTVPSEVGRPGENEERHGVACAGFAVNAETEGGVICESEGALVAVGAGLGGVAREAGILKEFFAESDPRCSGSVVVRESRLGPTGGDREWQGFGGGDFRF